jgi:hypothetical protein
MNDIIARLLDSLKQSNEENTILRQELTESKKREHKSIETKDLYTALAKAQAEMPLASLNASNPFFKTRYTDLAEIVRVSKQPLTKNGLSITQQIISNEDGGNVLITTLAHNSGQWVESYMRILPPKSDVQTLGSYISYLRRYSLSALICQASTDEDDDGEQVMHDQRALLSKGPAQIIPKQMQNKQQAYEPITKEQLEMIEDELSEAPDLAEMVLDKLQIQSLADMRKDQFGKSIERIRQIKLDRATVSEKK